MLLESLIGFLAPKVTKYLFDHLSDWLEPNIKKLGSQAIDYASEAYKQNRDEILEWVKKVVPGQRFDDTAAKIVDQMIVLGMQEVATFVESELREKGEQALDMIKNMAEKEDLKDVYEIVTGNLKDETIKIMRNF